MTHVWKLHVNCTGHGTCSPFPGLAKGQRLLRIQEGERREGRKEGLGRTPRALIEKGDITAWSLAGVGEYNIVSASLNVGKQDSSGLQTAIPKPKAWFPLTAVTKARFPLTAVTFFSL